MMIAAIGGDDGTGKHRSDSPRAEVPGRTFFAVFDDRLSLADGKSTRPLPLRSRDFEPHFLPPVAQDPSINPGGPGHAVGRRAINSQRRVARNLWALIAPATRRDFISTGGMSNGSLPGEPEALIAEEAE